MLFDKRDLVTCTFSESQSPEMIEIFIKSAKTCGPPVARLLTMLSRALAPVGVGLSALPTGQGSVCPSDLPALQCQFVALVTLHIKQQCISRT